MEKSKETITEIMPGRSAGNGQPGIIRRIGRFFQESVRELRRVNWPSRPVVVNYTLAALLTCLILGGLIWLFDLGVSFVMKLLGIGV